MCNSKFLHFSKLYEIKGVNLCNCSTSGNLSEPPGWRASKKTKGSPELSLGWLGS